MLVRVCSTRSVKWKTGEQHTAVCSFTTQADENTPDSFSIFNTNSVEDARKQLKKNLDEAVSTQSDPAERVVSIGKPGESQEEVGALFLMSAWSELCLAIEHH